MSTFSFHGKPTNYIFVWPGDDRVKARWAGDDLLIPSRNEVARATDANGRPIPGSPFRFNCALDREGRQIPGTLVLQDAWTNDPSSGARVKSFDAEGFSNGLWQNNMPLRDRGFAIVTEIDDIPRAMEIGRPKWESFRIKEAERTIADEIRRRKLDEAAGVPYQEGSDAKSVKEAYAFLQTVTRAARVEVSTNDLLRALGGPGVAPPPVPEPSTALPPQIPTPAPMRPVYEISEGQYLAQALFEQLEEYGIQPNKAELAGLLKGDQETMKGLVTKLEAKKAAEAPEPAPEPVGTGA